MVSLTAGRKFVSASEIRPLGIKNCCVVIMLRAQCEPARQRKIWRPAGELAAELHNRPHASQTRHPVRRPAGFARLARPAARFRRFGAKPRKNFVDDQAASPSSWKTPRMAVWMAA